MIPPTVEAGEVSEAIEAIATRLIGASNELSGLCATASESLSEVVKSVELNEGIRDGREFLGFAW